MVLIAVGVLALVTSYAGVQYLIARRQVAMFMLGKSMIVTDLHIDSIHLTPEWSVEVWWEFSAKGDPGSRGALSTETSWLGLGWTRVPELPGWDSL